MSDPKKNTANNHELENEKGRRKRKKQETLLRTPMKTIPLKMENYSTQQINKETLKILKNLLNVQEIELIQTGLRSGLAFVS